MTYKCLLNVKWACWHNNWYYVHINDEYSVRYPYHTSNMFSYFLLLNQKQKCVEKIWYQIYLSSHESLVILCTSILNGNALAIHNSLLLNDVSILDRITGPMFFDRKVRTRFNSLSPGSYLYASCVSELGQHCFRWYFVARWMLNYYLN